MNKRKTKSNQVPEPEIEKKSRFLLRFICIFLLLVIALGVTLGIVSCQNRKNAVARYGSYMLDVGEANYFASYYKHLFLTSLNDAGIFATDVQPFWLKSYNSPSKNQPRNL